ncbi:MAG: tetratricopeptide repeat protein [Acidobacteriota bacterium]|nr:MAG: tetratricopeptide repeat protein [Acidobacteriota bacterium]
MRSLRKLCLVLVSLLLITGLAGCKLMNQLKARDHLNKGVQSFTAKKHEEAVGEFKQAIELDPELIDAYLYLATTFRAQFVPLAVSPDNLRKGQEAIATFEKVLELDPDNAQGRAVNAIANIADIYRNMNEPDRAKDWYRKLMELQEDKSQALYGIASLDFNFADEKTGKDGENVENLTEEELAEVNAAVDEGIEALKEALEINPRYTDAMEYLNLIYREKAELAQDDEERRRWQREADKLALDALEMKRQLQREEERARREIFTAGKEAEGEE